MLATINVYNAQWQPVAVRAKIDEPFAIHRANPRDGDDPLGLYAVTHIKTGVAVAFTSTLPAAQRAARAFRESPIDWSARDLRIYRRAGVKKIGRAILEALCQQGDVVPYAGRPI